MQVRKAPRRLSPLTPNLSALLAVSSPTVHCHLGALPLSRRSRLVAQSGRWETKFPYGAPRGMGELQRR